MRIDSAGWTHVGRRSHNEDAWVARAELGLFVVADGIGGYEGGEVASRCVVEAFSGFCERVARDPEATCPHHPRPGHCREEELLLNCSVLAQRAVLSRRVGQLREMGSTVVALALGARSAAVAHVGDSRLYPEALRRMLSPPRRARSEAGPPELARWVREGLGQGGADGSTGGTVLEDT